jgi:hypothetical protein
LFFLEIQLSGKCAIIRDVAYTGLTPAADSGLASRVEALDGCRIPCAFFPQPKQHRDSRALACQSIPAARKSGQPHAFILACHARARPARQTLTHCVTGRAANIRGHRQPLPWVIQPKEGGSQCRPRVPTRRSDRHALAVTCYAGDRRCGREIHWDTGERACKPDRTFYLVTRRLFLQHDGEGPGGEFNRVLTVWGLPHGRPT